MAASSPARRLLSVRHSSKRLPLQFFRKPLDVHRRLSQSTYSLRPPTDSRAERSNRHSRRFAAPLSTLAVSFMTTPTSDPPLNLPFSTSAGDLSPSPLLPRARLPSRISDCSRSCVAPAHLLLPPRPIPSNNLCLARTTCANSPLTAPRPDDFVAP
jgi:hypothetical protein